MSDKEIISYFQVYKKHNPFKRLSVKNLIQILSFIEKKFKSEKGNYSQKIYNEFLTKKKLRNFVVIYTLRVFYNEYAKRKKESARLNSFIKQLETKQEKKYQKEDKLQFQKDKDIREFIKELKLLKSKYFTNSDKGFLTIFYNTLNLEIKYSVFRKYYYEEKTYL